MSNFDFDEILRRHNNDPTQILSKYNYNDGSDIFYKINSLNPGDINGLNAIIDKIVLWKLNRMVYIDDATIIQLYSLKEIKNADDALNLYRDEVYQVLVSLLNSKGVRLAMASTFLHFFNKNSFPIFDQRAYRVIYKRDYKASTVSETNAELYLDYLKKCIDYYNDNLNGLIQFSELDKYLYQIDIEAGNRVKM